MPDEILLEIFEYVSCDDLIPSFYNLNQRLNSIINSLNFHLDLSNVQQKTFRYVCNEILSKFSRQILSLKLSNKKTIDGIKFFLEQTKINDRLQLKQLILIQPTIEQFGELMSQFPLLNSLKIRTTDYLNISLECLPKNLRICRLSNCELNLQTIDMTDRISFIEEIHLKMSNIADFFVLLDSMIYLKRLTCHLSETSPRNHFVLTSKRYFSSLSYLKLNICSISFRYIDHFLRRCPQLISFTYSFTTGVNPIYDNEHIDVDLWNCLFIETLTQLKNFDLHISLNIDQRRDIISVAKAFQQLEFCQKNHIRIIYEITNYKQILCTIPLAKSQTNILPRKIGNAYSRIHHLDLILNETMINQQQHTVRCPSVHSFYLGLYQTMTPIEQQSRLLLNQSISFVYLKHFELYGTCLTDGFVAQLLSHMTNLYSLTLPFNQLVSCRTNSAVRENMKRIRKLQLALTETISIESIRDMILPVFTNLNAMIFAIDNKSQSIEQILWTLIGRANQSKSLEYLTFLEIFSLDQDWKQTMLIHLEKRIRYQHNHRILYIWL